MWKEPVESCSTLFRMAKDAMCTIAAVNVLCELVGNDQLEKASVLLSSSSKHIPVSLKLKLEALTEAPLKGGCAVKAKC